MKAKKINIENDIEQMQPESWRVISILIHSKQKYFNAPKKKRKIIMYLFL